MESVIERLGIERSCLLCNPIVVGFPRLMMCPRPTNSYCMSLDIR